MLLNVLSSRLVRSRKSGNVHGHGADWSFRAYIFNSSDTRRAFVAARPSTPLRNNLPKSTNTSAKIMPKETIKGGNQRRLSA